MSLDLTGKGLAPDNAPFIAMLADDELAARRIEGVLAADGMLVAIRGRRTDDIAASGALDPDVVVVVCGRGITERDQQMRRMRRDHAGDGDRRRHAGGLAPRRAPRARGGRRRRRLRDGARERARA